MTANRALMDELGFALKHDGKEWLVVEEGADDRCATITEQVLWETMIEALASPVTPAEPQTQAAVDVLAERRRQIEAEGWTPKHDDEHADGAMAIAAACYAVADRKALEVQTVKLRDLWLWTGWAQSWFKPRDQRSNLVRAGALILSEIERLDRAAPPVAPGSLCDKAYPMASPVAPAEPAEGWVLVPKRMTQEMRDVTDSEGWTWEDLLAEAGSISQEEYAAIAAAIKYHMGEDCEAPT